MTNKFVLGVDVGNVIIDHRPIMDTTDEALWNKKYSSVPASDGVFEYLRELNEGKFKGNIYLVSKLKVEHDERTLAWLKDNNFFEKTGIEPSHLYFVRERKDKDDVCRKLGITHFIDDRLEILGYMIDSTPNLYLFDPDEEEVQEFKHFLPNVTKVKNWKELIELLR
jgi:hypothetical protein